MTRKVVFAFFIMRAVQKTPCTGGNWKTSMIACYLKMPAKIVWFPNFRVEVLNYEHCWMNVKKSALRFLVIYLSIDWIELYLRSIPIEKYLFKNSPRLDLHYSFYACWYCLQTTATSEDFINFHMPEFLICTPLTYLYHWLYLYNIVSIHLLRTILYLYLVPGARTSQCCIIHHPLLQIMNTPYHSYKGYTHLCQIHNETQQS